MKYLVRLPWPDKRLSSNARGHWTKRRAATAKARSDAFFLAKQQGVTLMPGAILEFSYFPPDRRRRDVQNMPATLKAYIDGIADAMGCDDHGFRPRFPDEFSQPVKGGAVLVQISNDTTEGWRSVGEIAASMQEAQGHERLDQQLPEDMGASDFRGQRAEGRGVALDAAHGGVEADPVQDQREDHDA